MVSISSAVFHHDIDVCVVQIDECAPVYICIGDGGNEEVPTIVALAYLQTAIVLAATCHSGARQS